MGLIGRYSGTVKLSLWTDSPTPSTPAEAELSGGDRSMPSGAKIGVSENSNEETSKKRGYPSLDLHHIKIGGITGRTGASPAESFI